MAVELTLPTISPQAMTLESVGPITLVLGSVISIAPTITTNPTISGTAKVGETLTATAGDTTGTPPPTSTLQWQRSDNGVSGWSDISGATGTTYVLVSADETKYLRVEQTATNIEGSVTATSASTSQVASAFTGLLDTYSGAAAAYSLRLLRGEYEGSAIRVRRSDDNEEQDIGFRNFELDTSTLESFSLGGDCFVVTWFDQSGNANNLTQSTATSQPKIVSSGSTILLNEKPSIEGVSNKLDNLNAVIQDNFDVFVACNINTETYIMDLRTGSVSSNMILGRRSSGWLYNGSAFLGNASSVSTNVQMLANYIISTDDAIYRQNSNNIETISQSVNTSENNGFRIDFLSGRTLSIQELVIYNSNKDSERTGIETNINDHYSIYE